jgi:peptide/nickel transport system substrate-binding protein
VAPRSWGWWTEQNYDNFNDPKLTALLEQARSTANPNQRAAIMVAAEKINNQLLPWIPDVQLANLLLVSKNLTGATAGFAYMFAPWANSLGGIV